MTDVAAYRPMLPVSKLMPGTRIFSRSGKPAIVSKVVHHDGWTGFRVEGSPKSNVMRSCELVPVEGGTSGSTPNRVEW